MVFIGAIILCMGLIMICIVEVALISLKRKINQDILEDIERVKNKEKIKNDIYKNDIENFLVSLKSLTSLLRTVSVIFIVFGIILIFI